MDTDGWECPCDIEELEEKIVDETTECDVCEVEHDPGTTFYGSEADEWDVCEYCFSGTKKGQDTGMTAQEMQERLRKLNVMNAQRTLEKQGQSGVSKLFEDKSTPVSPTGQRRVAGDPRTHALLTARYRPSARVRTYFNVLGKKSETQAMGTIERINEDNTIAVYLDMGKLAHVTPDECQVMNMQQENEFRRELGLKTIFDPKEFGMGPKATRDDVIKAHYNAGAMNGRVYLLVQERDRDRKIAGLQKKADDGDFKAQMEINDMLSKQRPGDRMVPVDTG